MTRFAGIAMALMLLGSACGTGAATITAEPTVASGTIAFESERYRYSLELPAGWYIRDEAPGAWTPLELNYVGPGTDAFELDYPDRGTAADFPGITYGLYVSAAQNVTGRSLEDWTALMADTTDHQSSCHGAPDQESLIVDGEPANLLVYDRTDCEHDHHVLIVSVLHGDMGYSILWLARQGEEDARRTDFEDILSTFRFTE